MQSVFTIVDAHVHIYDCFSMAELLEKAYENSWRVAHYHGYDRFQTLLLLTETAKDNWFGNNIKDIGQQEYNGWKGTALEAEPAIIFQRGHHRIVLIAGYQVATEEGLEVLAIGSTQRVANGMDLKTTMEVVTKQGALAVIPWAVGKWLGKRGKLLDKFLQADTLDSVCLGDNSGRPWFWPAPALFAKLQAQGRPVLPGSDPLPLAHEEKKVASFGFFTTAPIGEQAPVSQLKQFLLQKNPAISSYGKLESMLGFFLKQIRLRLNK